MLKAREVAQPQSGFSMMYQPRAATCFRERMDFSDTIFFSLADSTTVSVASSLSSSSSDTSISINHAYPRWPVLDSVHRSEGYALLYCTMWAFCPERLLGVYEHVPPLSASFCCLHSSLALVQCCVSSMLCIANLGFSYKDDHGYILNPSEAKYNSSPSPLHLHLKVKAFLLNSSKPCRPQTSWHYFSDTRFTEYQPCLLDVPAPTSPVPRQVHNHL